MNRNRILLVDDDPDLLKLLSIRLTSAGYHVELASSAEQALANIALARPRVVITDLRMPGMDGMALFQHLHVKDPSLPVILLTAHGTIPDAVQATQSGVFAYLTKPYDAKALLQLIERAVAMPLPDESTQEDEDESWRREIVTASPVMESLLAEAQLVAGSDSNVLIQGESGTGKELLARAIHNAGSRVDKPFVAINCAPSRNSCSNQSFSVTQKAPLQARSRHGTGSSKAPMAVPYFSMRSAICRLRYRPSYCVYYRNGRYDRSVPAR